MSATPRPEITILSDIPEYSFIQKWYELADRNHFWMRWRISAFLNQGRRLALPLGEEKLGAEIGCGHGVLRAQLMEHTRWTIDGIEVDLEALKLNRPLRGQLILYNVLEKKTELENKYDFLFLYDVLEHIKDPHPFLEACLYHLKKGGYVFVNVPALKNLMSAYDMVQGHYRRYTKETLTGELTLARLKVLEAGYWGLSLVPLLYLRKGFVSGELSRDEVMAKGFRPPNALLHAALKFMMKVETSFFKKVPLGTSVMAVAVKE